MQFAFPGTKTLLIVDDDPSLCATLQVLFAGEGYRTLVAACGKEAVTVLAHESPDAVILDLLMPSSDGWYVLENLPADYDSSRVLVLSAMSDNGCMQRAARLGVGTYMTKPFDPDALLRRIAMIAAAERVLT